MSSSTRFASAIAGLFCSAIVLSASAIAQTPPELPKGLAPSDSSVPAPDVAKPASPSSTTPATLPDGTLAVPPLARVTDTAGVLSSPARAQLEAKLAAFEQARGAQIAVIVVPSTRPEPISDFANRVGGVWKIGRAGVGDGVLIVVAVKDMRAWISVARTLEGALPDVLAARISREQMGPQFAKGDFAAGLNAGVDAVMRRIEGEGLPTPAGIPRERVAGGESVMSVMSVLIPLIIGGAFVSGLLRRRLGVPGAALGGVGSGALAGFVLSSLLLGGIAAFAVFLFSAFGGFGGGGGRGRVLGGRGGPIFIPGGWSGGGGGWSGGGGGWSSGGGGDFSGGGGGSSW